MPKLTAILAFAAIMICAAPVLADESPATLSISGQGRVAPPADQAQIAVGVETAAERASQAIAANNKAARRILDAARKAGVAETDMQTRNFAVQPRYGDRRGTASGEPPRIVGYVVVNEISLTLREIDAVGETLDALLGAGANRINSIQFGLQDNSDALNEARRLAVADARAKAALIAEAAGVRLGRIISITEGGAAVPRPHMAEMRMTADAVPIAAGTRAVTASVHIVWKIDAE